MVNEVLLKCNTVIWTCYVLSSMAQLRARVRGEEVTVELTVDELHRLLELQRGTVLRALAGARRGKRRTRVALQAAEGLAVPRENLTESIKRAWPDGMDLVDHPELTTGNVRRFLIQKVLRGEPSISTADVCMRFFGRELSPMKPADAADLRRVWYFLREAKRDIEAAAGGQWQEATDAPVRAGTFRSWRYVPSKATEQQPETLAYREAST